MDHNREKVMHRTLKRKIEDRTVEALRDIIKLHPTMAEDIKKGDKDLSYDGYIRLFMDGDTESDKQNFDADIPIHLPVPVFVFVFLWHTNHLLCVFFHHVRLTMFFILAGLHKTVCSSSDDSLPFLVQQTEVADQSMFLRTERKTRSENTGAVFRME